MTRWRTCNNRRRRRELPRLWCWRSPWMIYDEATTITPEMMKAALASIRRRGLRDLLDYGTVITRGGERVDPNDFYAEPLDSPDTESHSATHG